MRSLLSQCQVLWDFFSHFIRRGCYITYQMYLPALCSKNVDVPCVIYTYQKFSRTLRVVPKMLACTTCCAKNVGVHYVSCQKCWRALRALCVPHFDVFYMFYMPKTLTSPKCHICSQTACHTYLTCAMCQKFNVSYTANTQKVQICEEKSDVKQHELKTYWSWNK